MRCATWRASSGTPDSASSSASVSLWLRPEKRARELSGRSTPASCNACCNERSPSISLSTSTPSQSKMTARNGASFIIPSVRSYREGCDPGLGIRPVIRAQRVWIEAAGDAAIVAEQLKYKRQRDRGQQLVNAALEPDHVLRMGSERIIAVEDDRDRSRLGRARDVQAVGDTWIRGLVAGDRNRAVGWPQNGDHVVMEVARPVGLADTDALFLDLERPFASGKVVRPRADEEKGRCVFVIFRERTNHSLLRAKERLADQRAARHL